MGLQDNEILCFVVRAVDQKIKRAPLPKTAFRPRLFSSLGCASARKLFALFGLDTQITILIYFSITIKKVVVF
jgi:hypothetical protein